MTSIYARHAWLGPGHFAERVLVEFDTHLHQVRALRAGEAPPANTEQVDMVMPGFVNAHCHLEYSWLGKPEAGAGIASSLPAGDIPFGQWMQAIIAARPSTEEEMARRAAAMDAAATDLAGGGCTTVIDSTTDGSSAGALASAGIRHFLFYEVLGLSVQRADEMLKRALASINSTNGNAPLYLGHGLNPHAPYSVGPWLRKKLNSRELEPLPQAWHLAESPDEEKLFSSGSGSIAEFLGQNGMAPPWIDNGSGKPPGLSSFNFLQQEGQLADCVLAFHGNTLSLEEAKHFAAPLGLVHCPGTHRWFARSPAPLKKWLEAGVNVCLGTDSLASSETLSMLDMIRFALIDNDELSAEDALEMVCSNPARLKLLNSKGPSGTLCRGKAADLVALKVQAFDGWRTALADPATLMDGTWVSGQRVWPKT